MTFPLTISNIETAPKVIHVMVVTSNQSLKCEREVVVTCLITCFMMQSLNFQLTGSKTVVDILYVCVCVFFDVRYCRALICHGPSP